MTDQNFFDKLISAVYSCLPRCQPLDEVSRITTRLLNLSPILLMILGTESEKKYFANAVNMYLDGKIQCIKMTKLMDLPIISNETKSNIIDFISKKIAGEFVETKIFSGNKFEAFNAAIKLYLTISQLDENDFNEILIEIPTVIYQFIVDNGSRYEQYFCIEFFKTPYMIFDFLYFIDDKVGCFEKIIAFFEEKIQEKERRRLLYKNATRCMMNLFKNCTIFESERG